jgi:hypothetical protein
MTKACESLQEACFRDVVLLYRHSLVGTQLQEAAEQDGMQLVENQGQVGTP